jgi:hypothetical protein
MANKHCYKVNIDTTHALKKDFLADERFGKYFVESISSNYVQIFNKEWFDDLKSKVGDLLNVVIFSRPSMWSTDTPHIDIRHDGTPLYFSLNWIVVGKDSEMVWKEFVSSDSESGRVGKTMANGPYIVYPKQERKIIEKHKVTNEMVLARIDVPHSIEVAEEPRIAIAIRPKMQLEPNMSWDYAVDFFRRQNLLIE